MHDGTVSAQSEGSGKGSTFIVRLPLVSAGARSAEPTSTAIQPSVAPRRILIVDDNQDAADSLTVLLQYQGHEVVTAYNGEEGLKCARTLRPHLVFLDLGMPRIDGIEAAQQLRTTARRGADDVDRTDRMGTGTGPAAHADGRI